MLILGLDEAGRGPVIGSMIIAGVLIEKKKEKDLKELGVRDSKLLTPKQRESLEKKIKKVAKEIHFIGITASEIDEKRKRMSLNELEAMKMVEVTEMFKNKPDKVIIDLPDPTEPKYIRRMAKYGKLEFDITAEHKADMNYPIVAAASIIAKVNRDKSVRKLEKKYGRLGTGYPHDPLTISFLEKCAKKGKYPNIVRKSWITARNLLNKKLQKKLSEWG